MTIIKKNILKGISITIGIFILVFEHECSETAVLLQFY